MSDQQLLNVLKTLGYSNEAIASMSAAAEAVEIERVEASRAGMSELLTPIQAAAQSPRHAAQLKQLDGAIFHASKCTYRLPTDGSHVNLFEVERAIKDSDLDTRARIKSGLFHLGLIKP